MKEEMLKPEMRGLQRQMVRQTGEQRTGQQMQERQGALALRLEKMRALTRFVCMPRPIGREKTWSLERFGARVIQKMRQIQKARQAPLRLLAPCRKWTALFL